MAKPTGRFAALRNLLSGDDDAPESEAPEGAEDGAEDDDAPEGDDADADPPEGEGEDDDADQDDDDKPAGEPDPKSAQFRHGQRAANVRWATVLTHPNADSRLEAATTLLANPKLTGSEICKMLGTMPKDGTSAARTLLGRTPRHDLRAAPSQEGGKDKAAPARKSAVARHNASVSGGVKVRAAAAREARPTRRANAGQPKQED